MTTETKPRTLEEIEARTLEEIARDGWNRAGNWALPIPEWLTDVLREAASRASPEEGRALRDAHSNDIDCGCYGPGECKYAAALAALRSPPAPSDDPGECVRCGDGRGGVCPHGCTSAPPPEDEGAREATVCSACHGNATAACHAVTRVVPVNVWPTVEAAIRDAPWCESGDCEAHGTCHVHKLAVEHSVHAALSAAGFRCESLEAITDERDRLLQRVEAQRDAIDLITEENARLRFPPAPSEETREPVKTCRTCANKGADLDRPPCKSCRPHLADPSGWTPAPSRCSGDTSMPCVPSACETGPEDCPTHPLHAAPPPEDSGAREEGRGICRFCAYDQTDSEVEPCRSCLAEWGEGGSNWKCAPASSKEG